MACRSAALSSARACSIARATPRRSRWCISSRASELGGYRLLDTQYVTEHLRTFGAVEIPKRRYHRLLEEALHRRCRFCRSACRRGQSAAKKRSRFFAVPRVIKPSPRRREDMRGAACGARCGCGGGDVRRCCGCCGCCCCAAAPAASGPPALRRQSDPARLCSRSIHTS